MQELLAGIVLIVVLGFGAFLYRNIMQRPVVWYAPAMTAPTVPAATSTTPNAASTTPPSTTTPPTLRTATTSVRH